jgi:hypothetical protein
MIEPSSPPKTVQHRAATAGCQSSARLLPMRVYAVVSEQMSDEALKLFVDRQMAELMVENWDRDEPDRAGELYVEPVELETSVN